MKLPKTVTIYGKEWKVTKDPKRGGGSSASSVPEIRIGTKYKSSMLENFLHEVIEAILMENLLRLQKPHTGNDNGDYIFVLTHEQFENIIPQIALALKDIIKDA